MAGFCFSCVIKKSFVLKKGKKRSERGERLRHETYVSRDPAVAQTLQSAPLKSWRRVVFLTNDILKNRRQKFLAVFFCWVFLTQDPPCAGGLGGWAERKGVFFPMMLELARPGVTPEATAQR